MDPIKFAPQGQLLISEGTASHREKSEIRVTKDYVRIWKVAKGGEVRRVYLSGRTTLRKLAYAILEAQGLG